MKRALLFFVILLAGSATAQVLIDDSANGPLTQASSFLPQANANREEELYNDATTAMNESRWQQAFDKFSQVAAMKGRRADGALYWRAYAANKLGRRTDALNTIAELKRTYPRSSYVKEGSALEVEIKSAMGKPPDPASESDEDLKLLAINSLMNQDCDKATPLLQSILRSTSSLHLKERALFVLAQHDCPQADQILESVARGQAGPDLQRRAIQNLGIAGQKYNKLLSDIYAGSDDHEIKRAVLNAFMISDAKANVLAIAKTDKDPEMRRAAIHQLGPMGACGELKQLFDASTADEDKEAALQALGICGDSQALAQIAKRPDLKPEVRYRAIRALGITDSNAARPVLLQIASSDPNREAREAAVEGLFIQGDAHDLVTLARNEKDPQMRRRVVEKLSLMDDKEAHDFMLELLK